MISKKIAEVYKNPSILGTLYVTVSMFISSILAYILQVALGRMLTIEDFGIFTAFLSLFNLFGIPNLVINASVIKIVSELHAKNEQSVLTQLFIRLIQYIFGVGSFFALILFTLKSVLSSYLNITDSVLFSVFGVYIALSFLPTIVGAYLQGLLRFLAFSIVTVFNSLFRLIFPLGLVYLGYRVYGVFIGMIVGVVFTFIISIFLLKKSFSTYEPLPLKKYYKRVLAFSAPVLFVNIGMMSMNNLDILLVKHYFSAEQAGIYAGAVTIGKILLFGAGAVSLVMYPQIAALHSANKVYSKKFKEFLFIQLVLLVCGFFVFALFSNFVTTFMFGQKYLASAYLVPRISLFVALYVLVNFLVLFFLAINKTSVYVLPLIFVIAQAVLIKLFHGSLETIVNINIGVSLVLLVSVVLYFLKYVRFSNNTGV